MDFDNVYEYIRKHFGDNFQQPDILDREISLELQMEFVELSKTLLDNKKYEEIEIEELSKMLSSDKNEAIKESLVALSNCKDPKAYRIIQEFEKKADTDIKDWAYLALHSSKMKLESFFLEKNGVLVSSGLGGKNGNLRYFVVFFSKNKIPFSKMEFETIKKELIFYTEQIEGEVETYELKGHYVTIKILLPLKLSLRSFFKSISNSCLELGVNLTDYLIITNVKQFSDEEIEEYLEKHKK